MARSQVLARTRHRWVAAVALAGLALAACASGGADGPDPGAAPRTADGGPDAGQRADGQLNVQPASYDLAATDEPERFIVGVLTADNRGLAFGQVDLEFAYLGTREATGAPEPGPGATGEFLPVPGQAPSGEAEQPTAVSPAEGVGVYQTEVALDRQGIWQVTVTADVADRGRLSGTGAFVVFEEHLVPMPGEEAIAVDNLTMDDAGDVRKAAIDSRAGGDGEIPDPELHRTTVAQALEEGRPIVLLFSTPVFCVSQFCGPITETISGLADEYGDRAAFIHIEVWENYDDASLNDAFDQWANARNEGREPWLFLIGADGRVQQRHDNVPEIERVRAWLEELPA